MIGSKKILDSKIDVRLIPSSVIEIPLFLAMGILSGKLEYFPILIWNWKFNNIMSGQGPFRLCSP